MEYVLETSDLSKHYKNFKALDGLAMHVPKGAIYGFIGRNGAGKTTLIRLICGLQKPTAGSYTIYGAENTGREIVCARRRMGAVVETPSIYLDLTAEENLRQQYQILGIPSMEGITELLELVGLSDTGRRKAGNFSLGMRQRLGIAIALSGNPDFLVLDEPMNGLDPQGIVEMRELILKLNRERKITFLISSHILDELARIATHYGFLDHGHMVKEISAEALELACKNAIHVEVSDTVKLASVLEEKGIPYTVLSGTEADIYGKIGVTELVTLLAGRDCTVTSMQEREESLESYYIRLLGGDSDE